MSSRRRDPLLEGARLVRRVVEGVLPPPAGGPPAAVRALRAPLRALLAVLLGFALGGLTGLLGVLAWTQLPDAPLLLLGLALGTVVGALAASTVLLRLRPELARGWGLALLPLAVLAAPFLLLWPRRRRRGP